MALPTPRRSAAEVRIEMPGTAVSDLTRMIAKQSPGARKSLIKTTAEVVAALGSAATALSAEQQRRLVARKRDLPQIIAAVIAELDETSDDMTTSRLAVSPRGPVETSVGAGIGKTIGRKRGLARIANYATPQRIEDWAGPVAGPSELERLFSIKRSTLHDWQQRGAVVGLLKGERKHVFPLEQFVDGRPVPGMARVTQTIANPRVAWQWLVRSHPTGDRSAPLARLKAGRVEEVVAAAERDFG
jgi:hypothetical protein